MKTGAYILYNLLYTMKQKVMTTRARQEELRLLIDDGVLLGFSKEVLNGLNQQLTAVSNELVRRKDKRSIARQNEVFLIC